MVRNTGEVRVRSLAERIKIAIAVKVAKNDPSTIS